MDWSLTDWSLTDWSLLDEVVAPATPSAAGGNTSPWLSFNDRKTRRNDDNEVAILIAL